MQQTSLLCWDLVQREKIEYSSLPFMTRKEVRKMKPSSFQPTIENQFYYICKSAMEDERKNHFKNLSRISKQEISFSNAENSLVNQLFTFDHYATDLQMFTVYGSNIGVKNDLLSEALRNLTKKNAGLLYFIILWI